MPGLPDHPAACHLADAHQDTLCPTLVKLPAMLPVHRARWLATARVILDTATFIARRASRLASCLGSTFTLAGFVR